MPHKGEARRVAARRTSVASPQRSGKKATGTSDDRPQTVSCRVLGSNTRAIPLQRDLVTIIGEFAVLNFPEVAS